MESPPPPPPDWYSLGWGFLSISFAMVFGVVVGLTTAIIVDRATGTLETHAVHAACAWLGLALAVALATVLLAIGSVRAAVRGKPTRKQRRSKELI